MSFAATNKNRFGDVNGSHAPSLGMAAMRKTAIKSEVSIWLAPCETLDVPSRGSGTSSNVLPLSTIAGEALLIAFRITRCLRISKSWEPLS
jgi:hypothetical protein